jgi:hypothetical protein
MPNGTGQYLAYGQTTASYVVGAFGVGLVPTSQFHVQKDQNAGTIAKVVNANTGASAAASLAVLADVAQVNLSAYSSTASSPNTAWLYTTGVHDLVFGTNSTARGRWMSSGALVVNAATNAAIGVGSDIFAVNGNIGLVTQINATPGAASPFQLCNRSATGTIEFFVNAAGTKALVLDSVGNCLPGTNNATTSGGLGIRWSGVYSVLGNYSGLLTASAGLAVGNTDIAGDVLDWYKESTFTAQLAFGGASVGMTGTFAGRYTRIGNIVTGRISITLTAKGSSTGTATITGLPYTIKNAAGGGSYPLPIVSNAVAIGAGYIWAATPALGGTSFTMNAYGQNGSGTLLTVNEAQFNNNTNIEFDFTYEV